MALILDDLTTLPPKKLVRRLEELAAEALPCLGITVHEASPDTGLTAGLWVDDRGRRDLHDLVRVVETEPGGYAAVAWAGLSPSEATRYWRVLLRVRFERPVRCDFDVRVDVRQDRIRMASSQLAVLVAARWFAIEFDGADGSACVVVPAPEVTAVLWNVAASAA